MVAAIIVHIWTFKRASAS